MKQRFFKFAKMAAQNADYTGSNKNAPAIGAVAVYKGSIVASAWNTNRTSPLQKKYNTYRFNSENYPAKTHCETMLIQRLRWKFGENIQWDKIDIYLYREFKNGKLADSAPCNSCYHMLIDLGVKRIFYSTVHGYVEEIFKK